jgi:hypothetical protein
LEALRNSYEAKMAKAVVARKSKQLEAAEWNNKTTHRNWQLKCWQQ